MNCVEFETILHDLDRAGTSGADHREEALAHAESCSRCGRLLIESESLDFGLQTLALRDAERQAPPQLEAALLQEFRRSRAGAKRRIAEWQIAVIGVAAVALLALGLARVRIGMRPNGPAVANGNSANAGEQYALRTDPQLASLAGPEDGTAFVTLPSADDSVSLEGGAVVRVMMPRSALASLGLPVSGLASTEQIPAELVVSEDGTPQAIRLISASTND